MEKSRVLKTNFELIGKKLDVKVVNLTVRDENTRI